MRCTLIITLMLATVGASGQVILPDVTIDNWSSHPGEASLCNVPDGSGSTFVEAYAADGQQVDATLCMALYNYGDPVANYPAEDIWLDDVSGSLALCSGASLPDDDTDAAGTTCWTGALLAGGQSTPDAGQLVIVVAGEVWPGADVHSHSCNSPDIDGDLVVNLVDVALFAGDFVGASYRYRSDLARDGIINLLDVTLLSRALARDCP